MGSNILEDIKNLPLPTVVKVESYEDLLEKNINRLREYLPNYQPLESDRYMKDLRVLTYKEYQNQISDNLIIKQLLITTATGEMLDHLTAFLDVFRLKGAKPYADYSFELTAPLEYDVIIPTNTELTDNSSLFNSYVMEPVTIKAGELKTVARLELDAYIESSEVKTEIIRTPLPFMFKATSLNSFENGEDHESDDSLRVRAIRSLSKPSTAGSINSYLYWIYTADSRIDDAVVYGKKGTLEVNVYLHCKTGVDAVMVDRVEDILSNERVRPLGDDVRVYGAYVRPVFVNAELELFDMSSQGAVNSLVLGNFDSYNFVIGQHLTRTEVIKNLQVNGVYRVNLDFQDVMTEDNQVINVIVNLSFKRAIYE